VYVVRGKQILICYWLQILAASARIREKVEGGIGSEKGLREARNFYHPPSALLPPLLRGITKIKGGMTIFWNIRYSIHYCWKYILD